MKRNAAVFKLSVFSIAFLSSFSVYANYSGFGVQVAQKTQKVGKVRKVSKAHKAYKSHRSYTAHASKGMRKKGRAVKKGMKAAPAISTFTGPFYYKPRLTAGPFYDTEVDYFGLFDLFAPYAFNENTILFADARYKWNHGPTGEGNYGLGMRHIFTHSQTYLGLYTFYDRRTSTYNNTFNQITLGGEFKSERWSLSANAYIPVGTTQYFVDALDTAELVSGGNGLQNIGFRRGAEKAMTGGDILGGWLVPRTHGLGVWLGGFYYAAKDVQTAAGPIVHAEWAIERSDGKRMLGILNRIHLVADYQHDKVRGSTWFAGARFDFLLGHQQRLHGIKRRMQDFVRRDLAIESGPNTAGSLQLLKNSDGSNVTVQQVSSAFTTSSANIIGVVGAINNGVANTVTLASGQELNGGEYSFTAGGHAYSVAVGSSGSITANIIVVSFPAAATTGNVIENITLTGNATFAIRDNAGNAVGTLLIKNATVTATGASALQLVVNGTNNVTIENSSFTSDAVETAILQADAAASNMTLTLKSNTFISNGGLEAVTIASNNATASMNVTEVTGNTFTQNTVGQNNLLFRSFNGFVNVGSVSGNTINKVSAGAGSSLVALADGGAGSVINFNSGISNNTINSAGTGPTLRLQAATTAGSQTVVDGGITNNTITNTNAAATAFAIGYDTDTVGTAVTVTGVTGNTLTVNAGTVTQNADETGTNGAVTVFVNNGATGLEASNTTVTGLAPTATNGATVNPGL